MDYIFISIAKLAAPHPVISSIVFAIVHYLLCLLIGCIGWHSEAYRGFAGERVVAWTHDDGVAPIKILLYVALAALALYVQWHIASLGFGVAEFMLRAPCTIGIALGLSVMSAAESGHDPAFGKENPQRYW